MRSLENFLRKTSSEIVLDGFKVFQHINEHFSVMEASVQGTFA